MIIRTMLLMLYFAYLIGSLVIVSKYGSIIGIVGVFFLFFIFSVKMILDGIKIKNKDNTDSKALISVGIFYLIINGAFFVLGLLHLLNN